MTVARKSYREDVAGRANVEDTPELVAYYDELERRSDIVYRVSPMRGGRPVGYFSFDFSFNSYPLGYQRPGPEIVIRRLTDCM